MLDNMAADVASTFPFLELPRELRDAIYNYTFLIPDSRGDRALRIERRHLRHFTPSPCSILLTLHHEYFLLNQQVAREALEALFKNHTVFLLCGPYVLKQFLTRIEEHGGFCREALKWLKRIELDWVTFPNLKLYPPERNGGRGEWWSKDDDEAAQLDYETGTAGNSYYDEHDYEGAYYDDNFYGAHDPSLYPDWHNPAASVSSLGRDVLGLVQHYPFSTPQEEEEYGVPAEITAKLNLLVSTELTPLFNYLATPVFALTSITLPLYFLSRRSDANDSGYLLALKIRYWCQVCIHALIMLHQSSSSSGASGSIPTLKEVRIKYMPWDVWASMDPADNLPRMAELGVWFRDSDDPRGERRHEGECFRTIWAGLQKFGLCQRDDRMGLEAQIEFVAWEGDLSRNRVGDELSIVFTKGERTQDQPQDVEMENISA